LVAASRWSHQVLLPLLDILPINRLLKPASGAQTCVAWSLSLEHRILSQELIRLGLRSLEDVLTRRLCRLLASLDVFVLTLGVNRFRHLKVDPPRNLSQLRLCSGLFGLVVGASWCGRVVDRRLRYQGEICWGSLLNRVLGLDSRINLYQFGWCHTRTLEERAYSGCLPVIGLPRLDI